MERSTVRSRLTADRVPTTSVLAFAPGGVMDRATPIGWPQLAAIRSERARGGNPMSLLLLPPMLLVFGTIGAVAGGDGRAKRGHLAQAGDGLEARAGRLVPSWSPGRQGRREPATLGTGRGRRRLPPRGVPASRRDRPRRLRGSRGPKAVRGKHAAKFFNDMGGYAPTIGIIGTVMGLVHVLENLSQPEELGHLIAGAFIATLWGVLSANVVWLPIGSRLSRIGELEAQRMELVVEGVMAIQAGSNPRVVAQRLQSLLPAEERETEQRAA
jgi:chemotaxis protein MotA